MEITSLDTYSDEELATKLDNLLPNTCIKIHRSAIIEVRKKW